MSRTSQSRVVLVFSALTLWASVASLGQPTAEGDEIHVSAGGSVFTRMLPSVAMSPAGSFVVAWQSGGWATQSYGRRFDAGGRPRGPAFPFGAYLGYRDVTPAVAMAADASFVVVWQDGGYAESSLAGQRYDSSGRAVGEPIEIEPTYGGEPAVAMNAGGDFVAVWPEGHRTGDVGVRRFDRAGQPVADAFHVDRVEAGSEAVRATADIADDGAVVVVWESRKSNAIDHDVYGQLFDPEGSRSAAFRINTTTRGDQTRPAVATAGDGSFVVTWQGGGIFARRYDGSGVPLSGELRVNTRASGGQTDPSVATNAGGDFLVAWHDRPPTAPVGQVRARRFHSTGIPDGDEFLVSDNGFGPSNPSVAMGAGESVVIVWERRTGSEAADGVFGRRYGSAGGFDADGDGVSDAEDNCPTVANAEQTDAAGDGFGDDCVSPDVVIPPSARFGVNPIIGRGTTVQAGVIVGDDAVIGEFVRLERQVRAGDLLHADDFVAVGRFASLGDDVSLGFATRLEANVTVGDGVTIADQVVVRRGAVVDAGARLEPLVLVAAGARIGAGATIEMGARIGRGATVLPGAVVPAGTVVPPGAILP